MLDPAIKDWNIVIEAIPDFIAIIDLNNKFVRVNKALADFLGQGEEELIGQYCYKLLHGTDEPLENCPHVKMMKLKKTVTEEINDPYIGFPLLVTASPILNDNGELVGSVHIAKKINDISRPSNTTKPAPKNLNR